MANTVLDNTAAQLSGLKLSLGDVKLSSILTLNNTQIKAGGNFEMVAATTGHLKFPIWGMIWSDFSAGVYTNLHSDSSGPYVTIAPNNESTVGLNYLYDIPSESVTNFTGFFGSTSKKLIPFEQANKTTATFGESIPLPVDLVNATGNIVLVISNDVFGAFTGGNSANTLKAICRYIEIVL